MAQTVVEKISQAHRVGEPAARPVRAGDFLTIRPRHILTHDNTAPVMAKFKGLGARRVKNPSQPIFALDHDIQNRSEANLAKYAAIEAFAHAQGIEFHPAGSGIGHQLMCEQLHARPGAFVVASDSHANTYGALGAVGTPVVRTDAAAIWATGEFWWQVPPTVRVELTGALRPGVSGKDLILALCGRYCNGEALNAAVEFGGPGVESLSMEARMTVANMTTEWGALVGWFPVDGRTRKFIHAHGGQIEPGEEVAPDSDAEYLRRIRLDLSTVSTTVAGPDTVQAAHTLAEVAGLPVQKAYLLSCVNSRLEDLESAARVVAGQRVADGVEFYVAAASRAVQAAAERSGAWATLLDAGARPLEPGCGPCIGLGGGLLEPGEVGISATNRNFKGRMGSRDAQCYLASPAVVAASALAGAIHPAAEVAPLELDSDCETFEASARAPERVEILEGFPARLEGRLVYLAADNLNTDGIYGKDYTYRDDITREEMARVVLENYDPALAAQLRPGDLLVGGWNFGTGSSREQAVTALQAAGIGLVVAASFSQTYLRNAFNNGFACIACPALVERLREQHPGGDRTAIPGDSLAIDFAAGEATWGTERFRFAPLGRVPQELVIKGGVENLVRERLGPQEG